MKRILVVLLILGLVVCQVNSGYCASQWDKSSPAGTISISDLDTYIASTNNAALDRLLYDYRHNAVLVYASASTLTVLAGRVAIPNAAGTTVRWRGETSSTTVTWANIDTGIEAVSAQYYVYLSGDTDETGFDVVSSTSSSAPSGITYYRKIGYFYNNSSGNIVNVGNIQGGGVPNTISVEGTDDITVNDTSYGSDMDVITLHMVSSGRPIILLGQLGFSTPTTDAGLCSFIIDVDGTDESESEISNYVYATGGNKTGPVTFAHQITPTAGAHTIKIQGKVTASSTVISQFSFSAVEL